MNLYAFTYADCRYFKTAGKYKVAKTAKATKSSGIGTLSVLQKQKPQARRGATIMTNHTEHLHRSSWWSMPKGNPSHQYWRSQQWHSHHRELSLPRLSAASGQVSTSSKRCNVLRRHVVNIMMRWRWRRWRWHMQEQCPSHWQSVKYFTRWQRSGAWLWYDSLTQMLVGVALGSFSSSANPWPPWNADVMRS